MSERFSEMLDARGMLNAQLQARDMLNVLYEAIASRYRPAGEQPAGTSEPPEALQKQ